MLVWGLLASIASYGAGLGSLTAPGVGLWPFLVSSAMVLISVVVLLIDVFRPASPDVVDPDAYVQSGDPAASSLPDLIVNGPDEAVSELAGSRDSYGRLAISVGSLIAFIVAVPWIGMFPAIVLLLLVWLRLVAEEPWRVTVAVTVGGTVALWLGFVVLLNIQFPVAAFFQ